MWLLILSFLLTTTPGLRGNEDTLLPLKELYYEVSTVAKSLEGLSFGPDPSLVEKTKKVLEEYLPLDISSGLPEQIELLELRDKADDKKTSEETRKAVMDGLGVLENLKEVKTDETQVAKEIKKIERRSELDVNFNRRGTLEFWVEQLRLAMYSISKNHIGIEVYFKDEYTANPNIQVLCDAYKEFEECYDKYFREIEWIGIRPLSFDFLGKMKSEIAEGKERIETIKKLRDLSQKTLKVKEEIKVIEELRDSEAIQKNLKLLEKLKNTYESMRGLIGLESLEWRIVYSTQRLAPIQKHFENLKISPGDLTDPIKKIETCLADYDFSLDFSNDETEIKRTEEVVKEVRKLEAENEAVWKFATKCRKIARQMHNEYKAWLKKNPYKKGKKLSGASLKSLYSIYNKYNSNEDLEIPNDEFYPEKLLQEIRNLLKKLNLKAALKSLSEKISKINKFLNCYSALKIVPSEVKSLMDQPQEVWNFDARQLDYAAQIVYLFKEAHRFLMEQKHDISPAVTQEDVTGITDGLKVLKTILDFQQFWIKNSDQHPTVTLEIHTNISDILIPSDSHLDALIDFYSTQYQGGQRTRILKTLKGVREVSSSFSNKLEKMNEAVTRIKGVDPGTQNPQEPEYIDCSEGTCSQPLPLLEESPP
ncbi:hypothetical protein CAEBREN_09347 [Caenorhabditis brenneri]|uniref:Domain of unknown function WSN domain-containing protein n=1 Tax=Caenorhabditis brenneri TaxID=135651 RepID=G0NNX9_CAEBE|nr:hypothetical protein CAEBREN_09347 [Caenorhabditis brenneri]